MKPVCSLFLISLFIPASLLADSTTSQAYIYGAPVSSSNQLAVYCSSATASGASCSAGLPAPFIGNGSAQAQGSLAAGSILTSAAYAMGNSSSQGEAIGAAYLTYDFKALNGPPTGSLVISAVVSGGSLQVNPACTLAYSIANSCPSDALAYVIIDSNESFIGAAPALTDGFNLLVPNGTTLVQISVPYGQESGGVTGAVFTVWLESAVTCSTNATPAGTCSASANQFTLQITGARVLDSTGAVVTGATVSDASGFNPTTGPWIAPGGIVSLDSIVSTIQPGAWASIFGTNLANSTATWNGDFPISLGGASVTIDGKPAYLSYVGPTQINLQAPDDPTTGPVPVVVTTASGTGTLTVNLAPFAPSFLLLDSSHAAGEIVRSDGSGAYGGGTYDILGPTGTSLGYATVAAKPGDQVELFAVGLGPTNPVAPIGQAFFGAAPTTNPVGLLIGDISVTPSFAGLSGAGLYQINLTVPAGMGTGDVPLMATVGGVETPSGIVISLQ